MITEKKLRTALTKIERWQATHPQGKTMSGLSIPAKYYFGAKLGKKAKAVRHKT